MADRRRERAGRSAERRRRRRARLGLQADRTQHPRDRRRASRQDRRRALRAGLDEGHAADQLVGGQEHHGRAGRHHRAARPGEGRRCRADQGVAHQQGGSAARDSRARSAAHEQRPRLREPRTERSRLVHQRQQAHADLLRRLERVRARRQSAAGDRAEHAVPLSQQRSADARPHREGSRRSQRRELPDVPAARVVRQDRRAELRARDRRVGQLHHDRLRLRSGARLGALRTAPSVGRRVAGPADSSRRLARIHFDAGARRQEQGLRRVVVAQSRRAVEGRARGCDPRVGPHGPVHDGDSVARRGDRAARTEPARLGRRTSRSS